MKSIPDLLLMTTLDWIFLETDAIADYLANDQVTLLSNHGITEHQTPLKTIINDVCAYIQARVPEKLRPNPLARNHVPTACKLGACHLVIEALQTRIPELKLSEDQVRNAQQARTSLEQFQQFWREQSQENKRVHKLEAVRFRPKDTTYKTLRGL